jgi:DnaJ-class molecular chaperone
MAKNYYIILGVGRGADPREIKAAYRTIAKKLHPDLNHPLADARRFTEITEAYETLVDPTKRRRYDLELEREAPDRKITRVPEIIRSRRAARQMVDRPRAAIDEFLEGFLPEALWPQRARREPKDLFLEVILSPQEALAGGLFPVTFPVLEACPRCSRPGGYPEFFCPQCGGDGTVTTEREFSLSMPPGTRHGTDVSLSLEDIGLPGVLLHVSVTVDPDL